MKEILKNIYYNVLDTEYNGLKMLFDLSDKFLFFDAARFIYLDKSEINLNEKWKG